jgi:hypothetical protein
MKLNRRYALTDLQQVRAKCHYPAFSHRAVIQVCSRAQLSLTVSATGLSINASGGKLSTHNAKGNLIAVSWCRMGEEALCGCCSQQ